MLKLPIDKIKTGEKQFSAVTVDLACQQAFRGGKQKRLRGMPVSRLRLTDLKDPYTVIFNELK